MSTNSRSAWSSRTTGKNPAREVRSDGRQPPIDFDPDLAGDHVRFGVRLRALILGECPLTRSPNQGTRDPQIRPDDTRAHSAIRCACTTERLLVSARDRNSQITARPGTTSPKLQAPAHLRTPVAAEPYLSGCRETPGCPGSTV